MRKKTRRNQIGKILALNKSAILREMRLSFKHIEDTTYRELMLHSKDGQNRLEYWTNLAIDALNFSAEPFYQDQINIGFRRAREGFSLSDLADVHKFYMKGVLRVLQKETRYADSEAKNLLQGLIEMLEIGFNGLRLVGQSFIATREEKIAEKIGFLQQLYEFTQKIMNTYQRDEIVRLTVSEIIKIFHVNNCCMALYTREGERQIFSCKEEFLMQDQFALVDSVWADDQPLFVCDENLISREANKTDMKSIVFVPIRGHKDRHGVLILSNGGANFPFSLNELELLNQFLCITAMVLENSQMVNAIEQNSRHLHLLTMRTLEVAEQEHKRISEDIHDTLTQALTGISYKLQYCQEIGCDKPEMLQKELNNLVKTVRETIDESRALITSLHPDIIDNIGIVSALKRLITNFREKSGLQISSILPDELTLNSTFTISLYRITQETLANIYKHAEATEIMILLKKTPHGLFLKISDNGKGFDAASFPLGMVEQGKFGLFYMRERIKSLGGDFRIHSQVGQGCEIVVQVPFRVPLSKGDL
jgi:signal transduction histidine kinase